VEAGESALQSVPAVQIAEGESASGTISLQSPMSDMVERAGQTQTFVDTTSQSTPDMQATQSSSTTVPDATPDACRLQTSSLVTVAGLPRLSAPTRSTKAQALRLHTRLQDGIRNEKRFTDGTIRYGCSATTYEPRESRDLTIAFKDRNWKMAMDDEIQALD
jgi:hypothetical protein